jgi:hypothetical protein
MSRTRSNCSQFLALLVLAFLNGYATLAQGASLAVRVPRAAADVVGYAFGYGGSDFYWFIVPKGGSALLSKLSGGTYQVKLICPGPRLYGRELAVELEPRTERIVTFHVPGLFFTPSLAPDGVSDYIETQLVDPTPGGSGAFDYNGCALQDFLLPLLAHKPGLVISGEELLKMMPDAGLKGEVRLPLKTPTELLLSELILIERSNLNGIATEQVEQLLNDKAQLWSRDKKYVLGQQLLSDESNQAFLGVLVAAVDRHEIGTNESSVVTVQYFSSDQLAPPGTAKITYSLDVEQEPQLSEPEAHVHVSPMHESGSQEIVPEAKPGQWMFNIVALPSFAGCVVGLRYTLWKKVSDLAPQKVRSGLFPGDLRLDPKPASSVLPLTSWEKFEKWAKEYRDWEGWWLASALAILQIVQILVGRHGRQQPFEPPE